MSDERILNTVSRQKVFPPHLNSYQTWEGPSSFEDSRADADCTNFSNSKNILSAGDHQVPDSTATEIATSHNVKEFLLGSQEKLNELKSVAKSKIYTCSHCELTFNLKGNLKVHLRIHSGSRPFECKICKKGFRSKDSILRHQLTHTGSKPFPCDICHKGFSSAVALKEHQARHNNKKLHECNICGREFRQNSCYRRHLTTHSKDAPYLCEICSKRFSQASYLRSHLLVHTGERPHSCKICGKAFAHLSDLNRHNIIHTGKRPYNCEMCSATFADSSSRRRHQKEHKNKSRMFLCQLCGFSFKQMKHLENHMKKKHSTVKMFISKPNDVTNETCKEKTVCQSSDTCTENHKVTANSGTSRTAEETLTPYDIRNESSHHAAMLISSPLSQNSTSEPHENQEVVPPSFPNHNNRNENTKNLAVRHSFNLLHNEGDYHPTSSHYQAYNSTTNIQEILSLPAQLDYVAYPDFSSQDYYNWLSAFTSVCKLLVIPIETELFTKITQVHKSVNDVLAAPTGVLSSRENFKILMSIAHDLHSVINNQLTYMLGQLQE